MTNQNIEIDGSGISAAICGVGLAILDPLLKRGLTTRAEVILILEAFSKINTLPEGQLRIVRQTMETFRGYVEGMQDGPGTDGSAPSWLKGVIEGGKA